VLLVVFPEMFRDRCGTNGPMVNRRDIRLPEMVCSDLLSLAGRHFSELSLDRISDLHQPGRKHPTVHKLLACNYEAPDSIEHYTWTNGIVFMPVRAILEHSVIHGIYHNCFNLR
jgi:hypothetical protein